MLDLINLEGYKKNPEGLNRRIFLGFCRVIEDRFPSTTPHNAILSQFKASSTA